MDTPPQPSVHAEIVEKMSALATGAFGLVAALAWNDAIQSLFTLVFGQASGIAAKFVYAAIITATVVVVTMRLSRLANRIKKSETT
jgi:hypothetical protein